MQLFVISIIAIISIYPIVSMLCSKGRDKPDKYFRD